MEDFVEKQDCIKMEEPIEINDIIGIDNHLQTEELMNGKMLYIKTENETFNVKMLPDTTYPSTKAKSANTVPHEIKQPIKLFQLPNMVMANSFDISQQMLNTTTKNLSNSWYLIPTNLPATFGQPLALSSIVRPTSPVTNLSQNLCQFEEKNDLSRKSFSSSTQQTSHFPNPKIVLPKITKKRALAREPKATTTSCNSELNTLIDEGKMEKLRTLCTSQTQKIKALNQVIRRKNKKIIQLQSVISELTLHKNDINSPVQTGNPIESSKNNFRKPYKTKHKPKEL